MPTLRIETVNGKEQISLEMFPGVPFNAQLHPFSRVEISEADARLPIDILARLYRAGAFTPKVKTGG